jgi:hypothetical protein
MGRDEQPGWERRGLLRPCRSVGARRRRIGVGGEEVGRGDVGGLLDVGRDLEGEVRGGGGLGLRVRRGVGNGEEGWTPPEEVEDWRSTSKETEAKANTMRQSVLSSSYSSELRRSIYSRSSDVEETSCQAVCSLDRRHLLPNLSIHRDVSPEPDHRALARRIRAGRSRS